MVAADIIMFLGDPESADTGDRCAKCDAGVCCWPDCGCVGGCPYSEGVGLCATCDGNEMCIAYKCQNPAPTTPGGAA